MRDSEFSTIIRSKIMSGFGRGCSINNHFVKKIKKIKKTTKITKQNKKKNKKETKQFLVKYEPERRTVL